MMQGTLKVKLAFDRLKVAATAVEGPKRKLPIPNQNSDTAQAPVFVCLIYVYPTSYPGHHRKWNVGDLIPPPAAELGRTSWLHYHN